MVTKSYWNENCVQKERRQSGLKVRVLTLGSPTDVKECLRGYEETKSREGKLDITKQTANSRLLEHPWPRTLHTTFQIQSKTSHRQVFSQ